MHLNIKPEVLFFKGEKVMISGYGLHFLNKESKYKNVSTINFASPQ